MIGLSTLLLLAAQAGGAAPGANPAADAERTRPQVEVRRGWVRMAEGGRIEILLPGSPLRRPAGPCYIELGAASEVEIRLPGGAQMRARGTAGFALRGDDGSGLAWTWRFRRLDRATFDIRRGTHRVVLPRSQVLLPRQSLFRLDGSVGGATEFAHRAGMAVELDLGGRFTFELHPGLRRRVPERLTPWPATYRGREAGAG